MPTVKKYEREVLTKAAPVVQRKPYKIAQLETPPGPVAPTAAAEGAQFGQALESVGDRVFANEMQKQDDVRLLQSRRQMSDYLMQQVYDPQKGMLQVKGENSYGLPDQFTKGYDDFAGKIRQGLSNDDQRQRFDQMSEGMREETLGRINSHVAQQRSQIDVNEAKATVSNEQQIAVANKYDAKAIGGALDTIQTIDSQFAERNGWGPEETKALIDSDVSQLHLGIIQSMLDEGNPNNAAKAYFDHVKDQILEPERSKIQGMTVKANDLTYAQQVTDTIKQKLGRDASLIDLWDEIPKYTQNPEVRKLAEEQLKTWNTAVREETRLKDEKNAKDAKAFMDQAELQIKNSMDAAPRALSYEQVVPQSVREQLPESVERAQREYWKMLQDKKEPQDGSQTFYDLKLKAAFDPEGFVRDTDLMKVLPKVSKSEWKQLVDLQANLVKGDRTAADKTVTEFRTKAQIAEGSLAIHGMDAKGSNPLSAADKALFYKRIDEEVGLLEHPEGKPAHKATNDELQQIVDRLLMPVAIKQKGFFSDTTTNVPAFKLIPDAAPSQPRASTKAPPPQPGERTASDPKTGKRWVLRGGQWVEF